MSNVLNIGLTGLSTAQQFLDVTAHNVANSATPGYSRQRVSIDTNPPTQLGPHLFGGGSHVSSIQRVYDDLVDKNLWSVNARYEKEEIYYQYAAQLDKMFSSSDGNISSAINGVMSAFQLATQDPASIPARQVVIANLNLMTDSFQNFYNQSALQQQYLNAQLGGIVNKVNVLSNNIANINTNIASFGEVTPNDLLDQRAQLILDLSEFSDISTVLQTDGSLNVFMGDGIPLVIGGSARSLTTIHNAYDPSNLEIAILEAGVHSDSISQHIHYGELGGIFSYREEVLNKTQRTLGYLAANMAGLINSQNRLGMDLHNNMGMNLLNTGKPVVNASAYNNGTAQLNVQFSDVSALQVSDYDVFYSNGLWTVTRLSDGVLTNSSASLPLTVDGLRLSLSTGSVYSGDHFHIEGTKTNAREIEVLVSDPTQLAFAVPLRHAVGMSYAPWITANESNTGKVLFTMEVTDNTHWQKSDYTLEYIGPSWKITRLSDNMVTNIASFPQEVDGVTFTLSSGTPSVGDTYSWGSTLQNSGIAVSNLSVVPTLSPLNTNLRDTVTITFKTANTFDVSGLGTGNPTAVSYTAGTPIQYNGWTLSLDGSPRSGDVITLSSNMGGFSDNGNLMSLVQTLNGPALYQGSTTLTQGYSILVSDIGSKTQECFLTANALSSLKIVAENQREMISGVNLDEEATNMMKYEQLYTAAAQLIKTAQVLFDTMIGMMR